MLSMKVAVVIVWVFVTQTLVSLPDAYPTQSPEFESAEGVSHERHEFRFFIAKTSLTLPPHPLNHD